MHILYFRSENSLKVFEAEKESPPKFHQTSSISSNTQQANKLLIHKFFKEVSKLWYCPPLRDFTYNSNVYT